MLFIFNDLYCLCHTVVRDTTTRVARTDYFIINSCLQIDFLISDLLISGIICKPAVKDLVGFPFHLWSDVLLHFLDGDSQ